MYDIKMLCQCSNISQQTFYRLLKENEEFRELVEADRQKRGNSYYYPESVLQWLTKYYSIPSEQEAPQVETQPNPHKSHVEPSDAADKERPLIDKINALEGEITALRNKLDEKEQEFKALLLQNSQLLCLLSQEKQEKQALLPLPKRPLLKRFKDIWTKKEKPAE